MCIFIRELDQGIPPEGDGRGAVREEGLPGAASATRRERQAAAGAYTRELPAGLECNPDASTIL